MKKLLYCAAALAVAFFAGSCQQEKLEPAQESTAVTFTVEAPAALQTRAIADGLKVNELVYEVWLTETLGDLTQNAQKLYQAKTDMAVENGVNKATITLDLVNDQKFTVLFWAQVKEEGAYDTKELTAVTYAKSEYNANNESLAAFYAVAYVNDCQHVKRDGSATGSQVTLYRPFAQLNLGTLNTSTAYTVALVSSEVNVKNVNTVFNVATSVASVPEEMTFKMAAVPTDPATLTVNGSAYQYAGMNYMFAGDNVKVEYDIVTSLNGGMEGTVNNIVDAVPLKENYRTNIIGNLLTSKVDYEIVVDAEFNKEDNNVYVEDDNKTYVLVSSAEELAKLAEEFNADPTNDFNIMLGADIDLSELTQTKSAASNWTPIGTPENAFEGVFNGNGFTIKNLNIVETEAKEGKAYIGFIGYAKNATIKNVTFENVNMNIPCLDIDHSQGHIGAVVGSLEGTSTVENVTVKGDIKVYATQEANGASRVAVVAGGNIDGKVTMKNVHVIANEGSYLIANNNAGALAGQLQVECHFVDCSSNIDVTVNKFFAGGLIGLAAGKSTFTNCHTTGDVAVVAGREGRANDHYRVGGIAGGWADNIQNPCILENCSYTGTVSGTNSDGSVAVPLDYAGFVGRGYTLTNRKGSTVIIDGVKYVQKYNDKFGIYDVDGVLVSNVTNVDELQAALNSTESVNIVFLNDIKGNVSVLQKENINVTIDGKGKKYNGIITVNGNGRSTGAETLTFKNINFDAANATEKFTFIDAPSKIGDKYNYSHNVTIDGCTFTGNYPAVEVGSASFTGTYNFVMRNCTATNMHSALQVQSCDNTALVENITVTGCKNGVSFGNTAYPTLKNSTINAAVYGVRTDGNASRGNLVVENTTINAKQGIVVRKTTTAGYSVKLGNDVAITTTDSYDVVFTQGSDDAAYVKPAVAYSYESVANFNVFPLGVYANNAEALTDALASGVNVTLTENVKTESATTAPYGNKYAFKMDGGVLDGQGYELNMECYGDDYGIMTSGGTVKNLTITEGCRAIMIMYPTQDIVLDNVKIGGDGVLYPINTGEAGAEGVNLVVTNSVLAGWTSYGLIESATFTNVEFKQGTYYNNIYGRVLKPYVNTTLTDCVFVEHMNLDLSALANGHKVIISNCTVNDQVVTADVFTVPSTDAEYDTELFTVDLPSWAGSVTDCVVFE